MYLCALCTVLVDEHNYQLDRYLDIIIISCKDEYRNIIENQRSSLNCYCSLLNGSLDSKTIYTPLFPYWMQKILIAHL